MDKYTTLKGQVLDLLKEKLPENLYYHSVDHTLKAIEVAEEYIDDHKLGTHEADLVRLAILLHDIGFVKSSLNHEKEGAEIAKQMMDDVGYTFLQKKVVADLIMSTRMPQRPTNLLERIICDVDLDYLGRDDYYEISEKLYNEMYENSMIDSKREWNEMQIEFLENHKFHTHFAKNHRQPQKELRLEELRRSLGLGQSMAI